MTRLDPLAGIFQLEQAKALRNSGYTVGILSVGSITLRHLLRPYHYNRHEVIDGINILRCYKRALFLQRFADPLKTLLSYTNQISKLYSKYEGKYGKPQVIHAHNLLYAGIMAKHISGSSGIPFVVTEHSSLHGRSMLDRRVRPLVCNAAQAARSLTCVSHSLRQDLQNSLGLDSEVLPNVVDPLFFEHPIKNIVRTAYTFINVASLDVNKNQTIILQAFAFCFKGMNVRLVLIGDGPLRSQLQRLAKRLDITSQVEFMGQLPRSAVRDEMTKADCFILSSNYETFGVVLIEALASGLPLIATRCGGSQDIVNSSNGILVNASRVDQLGQAMRYMHSNSHTYDRLELRNEAQKQFGSCAFVDRVNSIYSKALQPA